MRTPKRWSRIVELAAAAGETLPLAARTRRARRLPGPAARGHPDRFPDLCCSMVKLLGAGECLLTRARAAFRGGSLRPRRPGLHAFHGPEPPLRRPGDAAPGEVGADWRAGTLRRRRAGGNRGTVHRARAGSGEGGTAHAEGHGGGAAGRPDRRVLPGQSSPGPPKREPTSGSPPRRQKGGWWWARPGWSARRPRARSAARHQSRARLHRLRRVHHSRCRASPDPPSPSPGPDRPAARSGRRRSRSRSARPGGKKCEHIRAGARSATCLDGRG